MSNVDDKIIEKLNSETNGGLKPFSTVDGGSANKKTPSDEGAKEGISISNNEDASAEIDMIQETVHVGEDRLSKVMDKKESIEDKLKELGLSKDEVMDMIFQLTDDGYIEERVSLYGGRLTALFRSPKMIDTAIFIDIMDEEEMNTPAKVEFYVNLYSLASILIRYKGENLEGMSIKERAKWIEENIPTALYKVILKKGLEFLRKVELLSSEEVANFF